MRGVALLPGLVLLAGCTYQPQLHFLSPPTPARVIISSGLNEKNEPVDDLSKISLSQKLFAIHATLYQADERPHRISCRVLNQKGHLSGIEQQTVTITGGVPLKHWCGYEFKPYDQPGRWRVEVWVDNIRISRKSLMVMAPPPPEKDSGTY